MTQLLNTNTICPYAFFKFLLLIQRKQGLLHRKHPLGTAKQNVLQKWWTHFLPFYYLWAQNYTKETQWCEEGDSLQLTVLVC